MSNTTKSINEKKRSDYVTLDERGKIKVSASPTSSKHDFDFLQGSFTVHHKRSKSWLSNTKEWIEFEGSMENQAILMGIGNVENHSMITADGNPVQGFALRLFDPQTRLWSIYWAGSQSGILDIPVVGSFDGSKGYFFANDHSNGQEILLQFEWDITNPSQPVWKQAFSADQGKTWEWNWYMYFSKSDQDVYQQLGKGEQRLMDAIAVGDTTVEGGKLYAEKIGREKEELLAETEDIFFRKNDGRVRVIFIKESETAYQLIERRAGEDLVWKREA